MVCIDTELYQWTDECENGNSMGKEIEEQDVEDDPYLTNNGFVDDDWDNEEGDMDIDDLKNDYFLDEQIYYLLNYYFFLICVFKYCSLHKSFEYCRNFITSAYVTCYSSNPFMTRPVRNLVIV